MNFIDVPPKVHIGRVIRDAIIFDFKNWQGKTLTTDSLLETVSRLFVILREREIDYVLVGGIALLQYVEGRNTEDIDLIMALPSLRQLPELTITTQDANFVRGKFGELQIDILLTRNPLFNEVRLHYAANRRFVEQDIPCATVEGLLLLKLYALPSLYRQGGFARVGIYENDIAMLLHAFHPPIEPLIQELAHHLSAADLAEVQQILADIEERIQRFSRGLDKSC